MMFVGAMFNPESPLYVAKVHAGVVVSSALCPFTIVLPSGLATVLPLARTVLAAGATNLEQAYIVVGWLQP